MSKDEGVEGGRAGMPVEGIGGGLGEGVVPECGVFGW